MEQQALYLVADCSGSMAEPGKAAVLAGLLSYARACARFGTLPAWCSHVKIVAWSDEAAILAPALEAPLTLPACAGRACPASLLSLLERDGMGAARILLLSDGGIDPAEQRAWQAWRAGIAGKALELRAVAVGADAALPTLEALVGKGELFAAEDIGAALHDWSAGDAIRASAPWCLADTAQANADTDDWA